MVVLRWGYLHLVNTGILSFASEFTQDEKAWDEAKKSLVYFGVTGFSITERFLAWCEKNQKKLPAIRFLILDPEDVESLRLVASHRVGREATVDEVERLRGEIKASSGKLNAPRPAKTGRFEVKFYRVTRDFVPIWLYAIDGNKIYLGFPAPGKIGMNSPVYLCYRRADRYGLFNAYSDLLGRLGREVNEDEQETSGYGGM